jgi:hypothetical protein
MTRVEELAKAALCGDNFALRSRYQDMIRENQYVEECPRPRTSDVQILAAAASLIELLAQRTGQNPPAWTAEIGPLAEAIYLVPSAKVMKRLRELCENESPQPLHKRGFYAPPNFLEFA